MCHAAVDQLRDGRIQSQRLEDGRVQYRTRGNIRADAGLHLRIPAENPEQSQERLLRVLVSCDEENCLSALSSAERLTLHIVDVLPLTQRTRQKRLVQLCLHIA